MLRHPLLLRLPPDLLQDIDAWRLGEIDRPSRAEAVRLLLQVGLAVQPNPFIDALFKSLAPNRPRPGVN